MTDTIGIIVNGATGRMGLRQHLKRSLLPLREEGGVVDAQGRRHPIKLVLVGRRAEALQQLSEELGVPDWTTDLDQVLADPQWTVYADAASTNLRHENLVKAIEAGKAIYTEKPTASTLEESLDLARRAEQAGVLAGVVHDKLFLPGPLKLRRLLDSGFFGRVLSVRGEFGYWVQEGDVQPAQRPSWNYRKQDGGGMVTDMFPHWCYLVENLFAPIEAVTARVVTHVERRWDERGEPYEVTADDAAYATFELSDGVVVQMNSSWAVRVNRDELLELQVDGTHGSAVIGLWGAKIQPREVSPRAVWDPDVRDPHDYAADWIEVPDNLPPGADWENGFKAQWRDFLQALVNHTPYPYDLAAGARGVRLAEAGQRSSDEGRRIVLAEEA